MTIVPCSSGPACPDDVPSLRTEWTEFEGQMMRSRFAVMLCWIATMRLVTAHADDAVTAPLQFNPFVKQQAANLRQGDEAPQSKDDWEHRRALLKTRLAAAWGGFPEKPCDLEPQTLGEFQRTGYRVEKLVFQTRRGVRMTANAYVPDKPG